MSARDDYPYSDQYEQMCAEIDRLRAVHASIQEAVDKAWEQRDEIEDPYVQGWFTGLLETFGGFPPYSDVDPGGTAPLARHLNGGVAAGFINAEDVPTWLRETADNEPPDVNAGWSTCDANECDRPADWAYIDDGGDLYLCDFHGGSEPVEGWTRLTFSDAGPKTVSDAAGDGRRPSPTRKRDNMTDDTRIDAAQDLRHDTERAYRDSDGFLSDALEWVAQHGIEDSRVVAVACAAYADSGEFDTVVDDIIDGERTV